MKKYNFTILTMTFLVVMVIHSNLFAVTHTIQVGNFYFNPGSLNVTVGDVVEWVWVEGSHTTTSTSVPAGAASWDHVINSSNQSFSYTVTTAGTYNYKCTPHASMGMTGSFVATAPAPYLNVTPPNRDVSATAGNTSFSVSSNSNWTASSDVTWCTVTASGSGDGTLVADYEENTSKTTRTANITVSVNGLAPVVVQVLQDVSTVGIPENGTATLHVFPNPAADLLNVALENHSEETIRVSLYDLQGKPIFDKTSPGNKSISLDVADLPRGAYFLQIFLQNETLTRKVILTD